MNKKNLILGGILVGLIIIAYIYQGPLKDWQAELDKPDNFLFKLDVAEINRIEITEKDEIIAIEKIGGKWKISGTKEFYIKDEAAGNIFSQLKAAAEADVELVGENEDKKSEFNTDESGINVKLMQSDINLAEFTVGKISSDYSSTYISESGSNKTYVLKADIRNIFNKDSLHNKTIFSSEDNKISKIRFQYPIREFTVEREIINNSDEENEDNDSPGEWQGTIPYKFRVDQKKIEEIVNIMSNLTAVSIPSQIFDNTGLEKNSIIVQATGDEINNTIMIGDSNDENLYFAKRSDSDNIYLIVEEHRDLLDRTIADLK